MSINVRTKGAEGEREVCKIMNEIVCDVMRQLGFPPEQIAMAHNSIQRNQNQTAVGGCDLTNTFGLAIEVKRQEQLSINTWWKQCVASAERNKETPVLIYRQNRKPWQVITFGFLPLPNGKSVQARMEFSLDSFKSWFHSWVLAKLVEGHQIRS